MDTKRFFLYLIVIAALAMAGCGGNGGSPMTGGPGPGGPDPTPMCPEGQTGTPPNCVTPGPTVADLFATAQNARAAAEGAVMTAEDAVKDATKYSTMITVDKVMGDSMMAQMNAQTVLNAGEAATGAVGTAEMAVSDLEQAEMDAEDHSNDALDEAIAAAMKVAEQAVKDTMTQADSHALETAVQTITGTDEDDPMTAADHAKAVAMAIGGALDTLTTTAGTLTGVTTAVDVATNRPDDADMYVERSDPQGMTWAEIVGSANIMSMRINTGAPTGSVTRAVDAASIAGMPASSASSGTMPTRSTTAAFSVANGAEFNDAAYMGIPGISFCAGSDCNVDASGNLTGSWYFTPNGPKASYVGTTDASGTTYSADNLYARYGYWVSGSNDAATVSVYAIAGVTAANTATGETATGTGATIDYDVATLNTGATAVILTDTRATYTGDAIGLSLHKEFDNQGNIVEGTLQTGEFTADVELTATFGPAAMLGGRITNFQGNAVDSAWEVILRDQAFTTGNIPVGTPGVALGSATQGGNWTAQAYGNAGRTVDTNNDGEINASDNLSVRPTGIFGTFNAHFKDGHAAGAYTTRKQ